VVIEGRILGKPNDDEESLAMVSALAGRSHFVISGYTIRRLDDGREAEGVVATEVQMRSVEPAELRQYVGTGEGRDKAGAYAIQGRGAAFIERIVGSYTNVVGLPLSEVVVDLRRLDLWGMRA
jgi:septum formation protein